MFEATKKYVNDSFHILLKIFAVLPWYTIKPFPATKPSSGSGATTSTTQTKKRYAHKLIRHTPAGSPSLNIAHVHLSIVNRKETSNSPLQFCLDKTSWTHQIPYAILVLVFTFLVSLEPIFTFMKITRDPKTATAASYEFIPEFCFQTIVPIQYLCAVTYFNTERHLGLNEQGCFEPARAVLGSTIFTISSIATSIALADTEDKSLLPLLIPGWIIGRWIVTLNCHIFACIFCQHGKTLTNYQNEITTNKAILRSDPAGLSQVAGELSNIRRGVNSSIQFFTKPFSATTVIGTVGLCYAISSELNVFQTKHSYTLMSGLLFVIVQSVFFYNIHLIGEARAQLNRVINSPSIVKSFTNRLTFRDITEKFDIESFGERDLSLNLLEENASTLDWILLKNTLSSDWLDFSVAGIPIQDGSAITRGITLAASIMAYLKLEVK